VPYPCHGSKIHRITRAKATIAEPDRVANAKLDASGRIGGPSGLMSGPATICSKSDHFEEDKNRFSSYELFGQEGEEKGE